MEVKIILSIPYGVFFDGKKDQGFCFICSIALHSTPMKREHLNGRKHKNKLKNTFGSQGEAESCNDEEIMRCSVCEDILFGEIRVREHVNSARHKECMERKYQKVPETADDQPQETADDQPQELATGACNFVQPAVLAGGQRSSSPEANCPVSSITSMPGTTSISQQQRVDSTTSQAQPALNCQTSDDNLLEDDSTGLTPGEGQFPSSKQPQWENVPREAELNNLDGDSRSSPHVTTGLNKPPRASCEEEQAMNAVQTSKPGERSLSCHICDVTFTGKESSDEHFRSEKHKEKADLQEEIEKGEFTTDSKTGALRMIMDGIEWHVCRVCLCRMNSESPYQEHIRSKKHLKCAASKRSAQQDGTQSEGSSQRKLLDSSESDNGVHTPAAELGASPRQTVAPRSGSVAADISDNTSDSSIALSEWPPSGEGATNLIPQDSETSTTTAAACLTYGSAHGKNVSNFSRGHPDPPLGDKRASLEIHHEDNLSHKTNAAATIAKSRISEPIVKCEGEDAIYKDIYTTCKTTPRVYQLHLLCKIMASDSAVVFLPTGTGKTMTAIMAIRRVLTLNKTRPVLFLAHKVLLAMRQGANILRELGDSVFCRPDLTEEGKMAERRLKVATLSGGLSVNDATPLRKYDIIVITPGPQFIVSSKRLWNYDILAITAACCQNLLAQGELQWADFSMVILDEAHHCANDHPYKALVDKYHLRINPPTHRPKILGLTASPTGQSAQKATLSMIKDLLYNLGQAAMVAIDEKSDAAAEQSAREKLHPFTSMAKLVMESPAKEWGFLDKFTPYFALACKLLFDISNLGIIYRGEDFDVSVLERVHGVGGEDFRAEMMTPADLDEMVRLVQMDIVQARRPDQPQGRERFEAMQKHVKAVGQALLNAVDDLAFAVDELHPVFDTSLNPDYPQLAEMGLPVKDMAKRIEILRNSLDPMANQQPVYRKLLQTLEDAWHINWQNPTSKALVLVRHPDVALKFGQHLQQAPFMQQHGIRVQTLVDLRGGSGEARGAKRHTQDKILQGVRTDEDKTITVASSMAEKGVNISQTQLLVCLGAPSALQAVAQMQGREGRGNSSFVVLHSSRKEKEKMEGLLLQERNMKWAVDQLLHPSHI